jgi:hypothetical protein
MARQVAPGLVDTEPSGRSALQRSVVYGQLVGAARL